MNSVLEHLGRHCTVRRFKETPLDEAAVREVVRSSQWASTSSHVQGYALIRVRDEVRRQELVELTGGQAQVAQAPGFFVICADQRRHRLAARKAERPFAPNLESFLTCVIDASLFAQNLVLGFESLGLGCCLIGGLRNRLPEADALLALPQDVYGLFGLCVGEPDESPLRRPRLPLDLVLSDDAYPDDATLLAGLEEFDAECEEYYTARGASGRNWTGGVAAKYKLRHREHLFEHYTLKGAELV